MKTKYIILFILIKISIVAGNFNWKLAEHTVLFGQDIHLVCSLPNETSCCLQYNRRWTVGVGYKLIIMNGLSQNKTKYSEELNQKDHLSILTIKSLNEDDIDIPYECVYGFDKYSSVLQLKENIYEYHPKEKLPVQPDIDNNNIKLNLTLRKVYPVPYCEAHFIFSQLFQEKNLTSYLAVTTTRKNKLYQSTITFNHNVSEAECHGLLRVTCTIGKTIINVVDKNGVCNIKQVNDDTVVILAVLGVLAVVGSITYLVIQIYRKFQRRHNIPSVKTAEELTVPLQEAASKFILLDSESQTEI